MVRKVIAFDLDGTLAPSKSPLPDRMAKVLNELLDKYQVCVISGGKFEQFEKQLLGGLHADDKKLEKLHLMPTCGTRYYRHHSETADWVLVYAEDFNEQQKKKIFSALEAADDHFDYRAKKTYGEIIEDRGSQISWSAYGQDIVDVLGEEGVELKENWDSDNKKKLEMVEFLEPLLPEFEVRAGGTTTIDITQKGIDKAYGMQKLMEVLKISKEDIFFMGDKIFEGGNDYPVKVMGIDTLQVASWEETAIAIKAIISVT